MFTSSSSKSRPSDRISSRPARATSQRWQSGRPYSRTRGEGIEVEVVGVWDRLAEAGGRSDHRCVVGAERDREQLEPKAELVAEGRGALAQLRIRGDAATQHDRGPLGCPRCSAQLRDQLVDERALEGGG